MNPQERDSLNLFLDQLVNAKVSQKDAEAAELIQRAVQSQPDSHYLLVLKAVLQNEALKQAQSKIDTLQAALDRLKTPPASTGFFGSSAWGNHAEPAPRIAPAPAQPTMAQSAPLAAPTAGNSWLGNVATTAAGVVAGSFLFQGIESLMGHHNSGGFGSSPMTENTVINNYYDTPATETLARQDEAPLSDNNDSDLLSSNDFFDTGSTDDSSDWV